MEDKVTIQQELWPATTTMRKQVPKADTIVLILKEETVNGSVKDVNVELHLEAPKTVKAGQPAQNADSTSEDPQTERIT